MRELLEQKVNDLMDAISADPSFTNSQLGDIALHLNAFAEFVLENAPAGVDALAAVLDPILEMTLRVSTMLDAMQKAAKQA